MRVTLKQRVVNAIEAASRAVLQPLGRSPVVLVEAERLRALLVRLHPSLTAKPLIRLGPVGDGGYLVPDDLDGIEACFSPGVGNSWGFELECVRRGMAAFLADGSVTWDESRPEALQFLGRFIGSFNDDTTITMDRWVRESLSDSTGDLLLEMDIEGAEYESLLAASDELLDRMRIIVIEFHTLDRLFFEPSFDLIARTFEKLLRSHACVHIHPNNCCGTAAARGIELPRVAEFTFLRRDRVIGTGFVETYPHVLDVDCTTKPHLALPGSLYRSSGPDPDPRMAWR